MKAENQQPQPTNYIATLAVTLKHPKYCNDCRFHNREWEVCDARLHYEEMKLNTVINEDGDFEQIDYEYAVGRPTWCPLVEVTT